MKKYNLPHEEMNRFELYEGRHVEQMPKLRAEGRVPANVSHILQRRNEFRYAPFSFVSDDVKSPLCKLIEAQWDNFYKTKEEALQEWTNIQFGYMDTWVDSGDADVSHPDGRTKIVLDSQHLRDMTSEIPRRNGALIIGEDVYNALEGEEFKKGKLGKTGDWMSKKDVKAHPVWKVLARDQSLLDDYTDYIFAEGKERFGYDTAMGIFPSSANADTPEMRAWRVNGLQHGSCAYGWSGLGYDFGRLLGIAPEAPKYLGKGGRSLADRV